MVINKFSPKLVIAISLAIFFGISFSIRVFLPYDQVFSGDWIKFTSVDAYYQMRLVDSIVHNFPALTNFDPFFIFPGGQGVGNIHFFNLLIASISWIVGLGSPTQHTIDVVGVYFPAVLGALTVIPVYFIGKELFNRRIGIIAAALMVIMPGEFLGRSILGFTDQHVAEVLFSTITILFLILAIKTARQQQLTFNDFKSGNWKSIKQPLIYSLLASVFLLTYLFSWLGALLFVFIIFLYFVIQFIIDHCCRKNTDYLGIIGAFFFLIAVIPYIPFAPANFYYIPMIIAFLVTLILSGASRWMAGRGLKPFYYPLSIVGIGVVGIGIFYAVSPNLLLVMLKQFGILNPFGDVSVTTLEMQPIFMPNGQFSLAVVWGNFSTGFYFSVLILLLILIYPFYLLITRKKDRCEKFFETGLSSGRTLLFVWSVIILLTTLGQRRFAYYFAVNAAILTGYFSWQFLQLIGLATDWLSTRINFADLKALMGRVLAVIPAEVLATAGPKRKHPSNYYSLKYVFMALAIIIVILFVFRFNITSAVAVASQARFAPSDGWQSALDWMRENTPEPFKDTNAYYQLYEPPPPNQDFKYPESAYGVTSWWDYGYWITRIARRLPNANPSQEAKPIINIAQLFLSQEEAATPEIMQELKSRYIILDYSTTTSKFWAIVSWANQEQSQFFDQYLLLDNNQLSPTILYYPEYYQTTSVRLYNFDGQAVTPDMTVVVTYDERADKKGQIYKVIDVKTGIKVFPSYDEAQEYIENNKSANLRIVGGSPWASPVPLQAMKNYKLVYASDFSIARRDVGAIPEVKIFEYVGD